MNARTLERIARLRRARRILFAVIGALVLVSVTSFVVSLVEGALGNAEAKAMAVAVDDAVDQLLLVLFLVFALLIFRALERIEREADRLGTFMDNVYRRLP